MFAASLGLIQSRVSQVQVIVLKGQRLRWTFTALNVPLLHASQ